MLRTLSLHGIVSNPKIEAEVFVVEQNCVYQDMTKDTKRITSVWVHMMEKLFPTDFKSGDYFENASIGRVVIGAGYRDKKWGHELMQQSH